MHTACSTVAGTDPQIHCVGSVAANIEYARISDLTRQFPEFVHKSVGPVGYFPKTTAIFPIFGHSILAAQILRKQEKIQNKSCDGKFVILFSLPTPISED